MQANPATYGYFTQAEVNASSASRYASGVNDGNTSGIAWVQANPPTYGFFTQAEVNASSASRYASGVSDGNTSGIALVVANPASYQLFTPLDLNQSGTGFLRRWICRWKYQWSELFGKSSGLFGYFTAQEVADSEELAKKAGSAESLATVQADLARQKSFLCSLSRKDECQGPHTHNWYYQPGLGWPGRPRMFFPIYICPRTKMDLPTGCILTPTGMNPRNSTIIRMGSGRRS